MAVSAEFLGKFVDPDIAPGTETYFDVILEFREHQCNLDTLDPHGKRDESLDIGLGGLLERELSLLS